MKRKEPVVEAELVDIGWVAQRLGVTVRHVRRLVAERRIPLVQVGPPLAIRPSGDRGLDRPGPRSAGSCTSERQATGSSSAARQNGPKMRLPDETVGRPRSLP